MICASSWKKRCTKRLPATEIRPVWLAALFLVRERLPALRVPAIQAGLAAVQQDERGGVAFAAELRAGWEVTGDFGRRFDSARLRRATLGANGFVGANGFGGRRNHRPAHFAGGGYFSFFF